MSRILIIEDEKSLARFIELELHHEGFETQIALDGREGLSLAINEEWDLILLDLMLPNLNGIEICRRIRTQKDTPIIMLTARDSVFDRISGLDSGADDYLAKPFEIGELLARIRSLFRRMNRLDSFNNNKLVFKDLIVDQEGCIVKQGEDTLQLTKREYELCIIFMKNINRVLTREMLLDIVWGFEFSVETNIVDVYVRYLRNKLDADSPSRYIKTVRGIGYVMRQ
ncbi:response regulator transcription factor [Chengkuizengella axinellae]|uniref:Response regulator transcription factor n=1 Tax=Chengkuizengella axinellae TaxID=3064388 RepID=A0ABT9J506_9BACL|nr:response regulator transcription factor [Chengkuizengella sp. 2205SS18-9]MDP5276029.1 response regulator transcription factor [Chengkuizengella sp. 2205SS18-9]